MLTKSMRIQNIKNIVYYLNKIAPKNIKIVMKEKTILTATQRRPGDDNKIVASKLNFEQL
jgi:hypothetical protein